MKFNMLLPTFPFTVLFISIRDICIQCNVCALSYDVVQLFLPRVRATD